MTDADVPEDPHPTADADAIRDGVYRALRDLLLRVALVAALLHGLELVILATGIGRQVLLSSASSPASHSPHSPAPPCSGSGASTSPASARSDAASTPGP
jgi:hypothetical protein